MMSHPLVLRSIEHACFHALAELLRDVGDVHLSDAGSVGAEHREAAVVSERGMRMPVVGVGKSRAGVTERTEVRR